MIFTFQSQATGSLIMFRSDAENILTLLGKDITQSKGVIIVAEMPAAIATLQAAISQNQKISAAKTEPEPDDADQDNEPKKDIGVAFYQRAQPFLEMLKTCLREDKAITWGV